MSASNVRILALPAEETSKIYAQIVALLAAAALSSHKQQPKLASQPATELPSHAVLPVLELPTAGKVYTETNAAVRYLLDKLTTDQNLATKQNAFIEWTETFLEGAIFGEKRGFVDALGEVEKKLSQCKCLVEQSEILSVILFANLYGTLNNSQGDLTSKYPKLSAWFSAFSKQKVIVTAIQQADTLLLGKKKLPTPSEEMLSERKIHSDAVAASPNPKNAKDPSADRNNVLVTSALPYVNNVPHLGNIIGSTLSADVFARYKRLRPSNNVLYICGTDEYGTATETKALEENTTCQALCDKYHVLHKGVYEWFDIGFDHFGRTTTSKQTEIVQDMFHKLRKNNYLSEATMTQLFCEKCSRFLADRYVEGTCPKCKYADARGDQCDFCGNLLNASDLIDPCCKLDGNRPIHKDSSHVFLDLDKLQPLCEKWVNEASAKGKWSGNGITITQSWLKEGLKPRCITRDLKWGTPVPLEHMKEKVFYVWFEACMGYPSITAHCADWEKWWKNPDNVKLYQFMGKDNVPFHSVVFPSSQIGTGDNWTKVHHISTTEYLQYEGEKFSKSRNVGVFGDNAKETGIDVSVWRYYLLSIRPEAQDSTFLWNDFIAKNNNELLANLGNFCNRVLKFADAKYAGYVPSYALPISGEYEKKLIQDVNALLKDYIDAMENVRIRLGLQIAMHISARGNLYLQNSNVNNALFSNQPKKCAAVVGAAINLIYLISALIHPYMPSAAEDIANQLNAPLPIIPDTFTMDALSPGHRIGKPRHLFSRIPEEKADEWRAKYGGGSAASAANALAASALKKGAKKELKKDGAKGS